MPEYLADVLLNIISPRDKHQHAKFPAYYRWCRGPIRSQVQRFSDLGYDIVEYRGLFGHGYYKKIKILDKIHDLKTKYLLRHSNPFLTSYAYVVLKNAGRSAAPDRAWACPPDAPRPLMPNALPVGSRSERKQRQLHARDYFILDSIACYFYSESSRASVG